MATKQGGLLATLGKRLLGFNTSSSGCCAAPAAAAGPEKAEAVKAAEAVPAEAGCCAPTCCSNS
jgi:hypothetical protein